MTQEQHQENKQKNNEIDSTFYESIPSYVSRYLIYFVNKTNKAEIKGEFIYRGQSSANWEVLSSAQRRLDEQKKIKSSEKTKTYNHHDFILYHKHLLENARKLGYDYNDSLPQRLNDLELLAEIQHHGGATCLTDFTTNFLVALWFASEENKESCDVKHHSDSDIYGNPVTNAHGKVFALNRDSESNLGKLYPVKDTGKNEDYILSKLLEKKIQYNGQKKEIELRFWIWKPARLNNRIIQQDSIFMFGLGNFEGNLEYEPIFIAPKDKKKIREELETFFSFSVETVFDDLPGFSFEANNWKKEISKNIFEDKNCKYKAIKAFKKGEYDVAIKYYNQALKCIDKKNCTNICDNKHDELYLERGKCYYQIKQDSTKALSDFNKVIELNIVKSNNDNNTFGACRFSVIILYEQKAYSAAFNFCIDIINNAHKYKISNTSEFYFSALELSILLEDQAKYERIRNLMLEKENEFLLENNGRLLFEYFITINSSGPKLVTFVKQIEKLSEGIKYNPESNWIFDDIEKWVKTKNDYEKLLITQKFIEVQERYIDELIDQKLKREQT